MASFASGMFTPQTPHLGMAVAALVLVVAGACSSNGTTSPTSADAAAMSDGSGSSPDAAVSDAPTEALASDGGADADAGPPLTCSPNVWLDQNTWDSCPELGGTGPRCNCYGYAPDGGSLMFQSGLHMQMDITSFLLPTPMTAGQPYSLSVTVSNNGYYGDVEFWGSNATCGSGLELLYQAPLDSKVYCADVHPSQSYTYILFVQRLNVDSGAPAGESAHNTLACPSSRCP